MTWFQWTVMIVVAVFLVLGAFMISVHAQPADCRKIAAVVEDLHQRLPHPFAIKRLKGQRAFDYIARFNALPPRTFLQTPGELLFVIKPIPVPNVIFFIFDDRGCFHTFGKLRRSVHERLILAINRDEI